MSPRKIDIEQVRRESVDPPFVATPFGSRPFVYADYTASGRPLRLLERVVSEDVTPWYGNTHSEASEVGKRCTSMRERARDSIRRAVGADESYAVIFVGSGTTGAIGKFVQMLGIWIPPATEERFGVIPELPDWKRPVVFVSAYEHHSNLLPWRESLAEVVEVEVDDSGRISTEHLQELVSMYEGRPLIGAFSAASNVTGVVSPLRELCSIVREAGGIVCADYASGGPHLQPTVRRDGIDAAFFSPHKYPGGPRTPGILVVRTALCCNRPTLPGGGTVDWVSSSGQAYSTDVQAREEAGTPDIVGSVLAGLVFDLQQSIGVERIREIETEQREYLESSLRVPNIRLVGSTIDSSQRVPIVPIEVRMGDKRLHYNFVVTLLNDLFGIQARGGCLCAGPYLRKLMHECTEEFCEIVGDQPGKPGVVRISLCYSMKPESVRYVANAMKLIASDGFRILPEYEFVEQTGAWVHRGPRRNMPLAGYDDCIRQAREVLQAGPRKIVEQSAEGFAASLDAIEYMRRKG